MDLALTPAEQAFRHQVRDFFANDYPQHILAKTHAGQKLTRDDHIASQRALNARGWFGVSWPKEFGGPGWTPTERYIFDEELETIGAPGIIPMAVIYIGPIICAFGTPEQQAHWLPDILESRAMWAQGYSEPESGSDLASLRMTAVRDGDDYILDGTKIWTSSAHWADWIFCLVRTSQESRKQDGISLICADMRTPGITVALRGAVRFTLTVRTLTHALHSGMFGAAVPDVIAFCLDVTSVFSVLTVSALAVLSAPPVLRSFTICGIAASISSVSVSLRYVLISAPAASNFAFSCSADSAGSSSSRVI